MRRARFVLGVLALFLGTLIATSIAEARVGRGGGSGSRGSRSYSAPRTPSSPVSPTSPSSPQRSTPSPSRPGGFLGGFGGMLGGFLLGGLLGSLLFGGLGHGFGGIGLMDLLLIGGLIALAVMFLRRRAAQPAPAAAYAGGAPSGAGWGPRPVDEPAATTAATRAPAGSATLTADDQDLASGIDAIRTMDPGFDPPRFTAIASDLFERLQIGWSGGDLTAIRAHLTDEMAVSLERDLGSLTDQGRANRMERVTVQSAELTEAWQEYGRDLVTMRFRASALDYTVDRASGRVVDGSDTTPVSFEEYWTFARKVGPNPWQLSAIQQTGR